MKKFVLVFLSILLILSVAGCASNNAANTSAEAAPAEAETSTEAEAANDSPKKIGLLLPTLQSEFFVFIADGLEERFTAEGFEVSAMSFDGDANKAISIVENFTIENVDCIIAMVSDNSVDSALKGAMDKGITVIEAGIITDTYDFGLVADNKDVGLKIAEMAADYINNELGGSAKVAAFINETSSDMADRSNSLLENLATLAPNAEIVAKTSYVNVGDATAAMENFFQQNPDIQVVVSYGDQAAIESVEVAKAANKTEGFATFSCDATQQALKSIYEGGLVKGTVSMGSLIDMMADPTIAILNGNPPSEKIIIGTNTKVTAENIADFYTPEE